MTAPDRLWLSPRDLEIVCLAVNGATDVEISQATGISLYGIHERWRSFIRPNLGAVNRTHAVAIAITAGLVPPGVVRPLGRQQPPEAAPGPVSRPPGAPVTSGASGLESASEARSPASRPTNQTKAA